MRLGLVLLSITLSSAAGNDQAMRLLDDWIVIVDQHAAGEPDQAVATFADWNADDLSLARMYVEAFIGVPLDTRARAARRASIRRTDLAAIRQRTLAAQARGDFDTFRKRAVILHTDAAIFGFLPGFVPPPIARWQQRLLQRGGPEPDLDVKSFDGRVERLEMVNPHWQIAMDLLDALPATPRRDAMVPQWYRAIGAHFAEQHNFADAMRHFEQARRVVPDDPDVLLGEACFQETLGSPRVQNMQRVTTLPNGMVLIGVSSAATHHRRAEALLKRALAARPEFVEARLRLGRVLSQQGEHDAALAQFAQVAAESSDARVRYYAHLFAGDAALALDRPQQSRASYERALASHPFAQAARLGLAAALRAAGDRAGAIEAVMATVTVPADERDTLDDPWWIYYEGEAADVERLLSELRAPFRSPRQ